MGTHLRDDVLSVLQTRFGAPRRLQNSRSLYAFGNSAIRVYFRYSKVHARARAFYGLRKIDLLQLDGREAFICFLWDGQEAPLFVSYIQFEDVFASLQPAQDGQYKVQLFIEEDSVQLYVPGAGRFNVEGYLGWDKIGQDQPSQQPEIASLAHSQVQTLLGAIGSRKAYDIWIPPNDRGRLDWSIAEAFSCRDCIPATRNGLGGVLEEVDVIWAERGTGVVHALFEVEHTTPVYSGLLRLNDVRIADPRLGIRFGVAASDSRRGMFSRQINRPTFRASGLSDLCMFMDYADVWAWHQRLAQQRQ